MKTITNRSLLTLVAAGSLLLAGAPAFALTDSQITDNVRTRLEGTTGTKEAPVIVETIDGTVYLSGEARNPAESHLIERTARGAEGVGSIRNNLNVLDSLEGGSD